MYPQPVLIANQAQDFLQKSTGADPALTNLTASGDYVTAASDLYAIATLLQIPPEVSVV